MKHHEFKIRHVIYCLPLLFAIFWVHAAFIRADKHFREIESQYVHVSILDNLWYPEDHATHYISHSQEEWRVMRTFDNYWRHMRGKDVLLYRHHASFSFPAKIEKWDFSAIYAEMKNSNDYNYKGPQLRNLKIKTIEEWRDGNKKAN